MRNKLIYNDETDENIQPSLWYELVSGIKYIIIVIAFSIIISKCVIINAQIPSGSMENTVMTNDRLIASRLSYKFGNPERGDVAVFYYPVEQAIGTDKLYIKRIIGLQGEQVTIKDAKIYINDSITPLEEPYLKEEWTVLNNDIVFQVPENCYLMLGDNRNDSLDARWWAGEAIKYQIADNLEDAQQFCYVEREQIVGKAGLRYWPLNEIKLVE